jgi:DNA-binding MarR family transcriptional regulator
VSALKPLDPLLHSQVRLAVISTLISVKSAEFTYLKEITEATSGNLSVQLSKLEEAGYIRIKKTFRDKRPLTTCSITKTGIEAFEHYVDNLKKYIQ